MGVLAERTRLAPSPTGALHLGNARTFLVTWALARRSGWRVLLRIEDLDSPRVKRGSESGAVSDLTWLGMDWDEGPVRQSDDLSAYRGAMSVLSGAGAAYPSEATRGEIESSASAASAPQEGSGESVFPASMRPAGIGPRGFDREDVNWRLVVDEGVVEFEDGLAGRWRADVARSVGDFVVWTRRGVPAYQLAVVVDDARQGVTRVVRGDDLLDSTARQLLVARALGLSWRPAWLHLPLVRGPDGRRLAKRHGDTRVSSYRGSGVRAERIVGLAAAWSGITSRDRPEEMSAAEFLGALDVGKIPREPVVMTPEDDRWLRAGH